MGSKRLPSPTCSASRLSVGGEGGYEGSQSLARGLTHSIENKKHRVSPKLLAWQAANALMTQARLGLALTTRQVSRARRRRGSAMVLHSLQDMGNSQSQNRIDLSELQAWSALLEPGNLSTAMLYECQYAGD